MWKKYILVAMAIIATEIVVGYYLTSYGLRFSDTMYIFSGAFWILAIVCLAGGILNSIYIAIRKPKIEE